MPYATPTLYLQRFGVDEAVQLLADEEGLLTKQLLLDAIAGTWTGSPSAQEQAAGTGALARLQRQLAVDSNFMDGYLRAVVQLPLSGDDANAGTLEECNTALTRFGVSDDADNATERLDKAADWWRKWLLDVSKGAVQLVNPSGEPVTGTRRVRSGQASSRFPWLLYGNPDCGSRQR